ncbi:MAG TPA: aminoglycoside adenylyltransferase domain-containing protein [Anaerolineales bacterium]|nr:aminoglycoside adenylyltransferase domain-containing protein [Anaerolineales bacterium]
MLKKISDPTPYPEVNTILHELFVSVTNILGIHFVGMYLDGSLANGDFDEDSDIDFVVVTDEDVSGELLLELQALHDRIARIDSPFAVQLEGSYISLAGMRRYDPEHALHPNIQRGEGERLKMAIHDDWWVIHRFIVRERGVVIYGPAPQTLIDRLAPEDLQRTMLSLLNGWARDFLDNPDQMNSRGYQSYVVLSLCRILYTLESGDVVSKPVAARWAREKFNHRWESLIERAWVGRHHPQERPDPEEIERTREFIRFALQYSQRFEIS